jgi:hypothetical protein
MTASIRALSPFWQTFAIVILAVGWVATTWFLARYTVSRPWSRSEAGRHLVAFSAAVWGFFTLYLLLFFLPNLPGQKYIRLVLLVGIVGCCVWRAVMFERVARADRRDRERVS